MNVDDKNQITIAHARPTDVRDGGQVVGTLYGSSRHDERGRLVLGLGLREESGYREIDVFEGDKFAIGGTTLQVTKIFEPVVREPINDPDSSFSGPISGGGGSIALLTRVSEQDG